MTEWKGNGSNSRVTNFDEYRKNYDTYMAKGWGGQFIVVIPELELVTVVTGGNYDVNSSSADVPFSIYDDIVYGHVLPAVR